MPYRGSGPQPKILLVVEDDDPVREALAEYLRDSDFSVIEAGDAQQARVVLETRHADVALMITDVRMPGDMDGLQLAEWVARKFPSIALLVTSGFIGGNRYAAPFPFIPKPYSLARITAEAQKLLSREPA